jgi:hypothetical protein
VHDTQTTESLGHLGGEHRRTVVVQGRARKPTLLERLRETVRYVLRVLGEVPLQMTGEARP